MRTKMVPVFLAHPVAIVADLVTAALDKWRLGR